MNTYIFLMVKEVLVVCDHPAGHPLHVQMLRRGVNKQVGGADGHCDPPSRGGGSA